MDCYVHAAQNFHKPRRTRVLSPARPGHAGRVHSAGVTGMADWTNVRRLTAPALLVVAMALPRLAAAQELTAYATASLDGHQTSIGLIGASVRAAGLGLRPVVALQVYRLQYDAGGTVGDVTVVSVGPSAGVSYRTSGGAVEGRVGYNFQSEEDEDVLQEGEGGGGGVTTSVQALSWASRPELQGIASYNWGSEYLWSTAQALVPIRELNPGGIAVGGEVVWQGNVGAEDRDYQSWQVGPVLRWSTGRESSVIVGAGYKDSNSRDATWYARIGLVKYGISLGLL